MQHKIYVRESIKSESPTAVQHVFRLRFNIQPPTRKSICRLNHQFEQIGCLCKGKISSRLIVSEENVRRIQESFERSPRKSTRRASRELGIPQPTVWRVLRRRLLFKCVNLFNHPAYCVKLIVARRISFGMEWTLLCQISPIRIQENTIEMTRHKFLSTPVSTTEFFKHPIMGAYW